MRQCRLPNGSIPSISAVDAEKQFNVIDLIMHDIVMPQSFVPAVNRVNNFAVNADHVSQ